MHSFGTIPERDYTEEKQDAFFWVTFQFRNERNTIPVIPPPKVNEQNRSENGLYVYSHSGIVPKECTLFHTSDSRDTPWEQITTYQTRPGPPPAHAWPG